MNEHDGLCPCCGGSGGGDDPVRRCPECGGTGRAAIPQTPLAADVPPGTPLHELARLAADAPEVRREVVRADPTPGGPPVRVVAEPCRGCDLRPGDLFSTAGPEYWDHFAGVRGVGERVYVRTHNPPTPGDEGAAVYRLRVVPAGAAVVPLPVHAEAARRLPAFDDAHAIVAELRRWLADGRAPFAASSFDGSRNWAQVLEDYFTRVSP